VNFQIVSRFGTEGSVVQIQSEASGFGMVGPEHEPADGLVDQMVGRLDACLLGDV
jgi:hypothetical protein